MRNHIYLSITILVVFTCATFLGPARAGNLEKLDAPLLFVKRHPYFSGHIYDDYYTWHPGGGIYVIENPAAPPDKHVVRATIDPATKETLGEGVYRDVNLSWDAARVVFAFKGEEKGDTSIYEIGVDGTGLRRLTNPSEQPCEFPVRAFGEGRHDITPAYLPDGRIVFTSTRPAGRVPCFNSEVDLLHIMNADGSDVHTISVNNVNEFDPAVLPDGRILFGRWEYVDKTALYMQSLWTIFPDGSNETAFFANNMAKPTAVLDARPIPGTQAVVASLTPHNGQSVGAIAVIDTRLGKNNLGAITNLTPKYPTEMDQGLKRGPSDPWPVSENLFLMANNAEENGDHGVIELVDLAGNRERVYADPDISCYSPMLVKPRSRPPVIPASRGEGRTGLFFVQDIHRGLAGVEPGEVKWLRVVEETTRVSGIPGGGRWWNQAFLVSWQGAYIVKNILGVVPVHADGSAYFEAPAGRAIYFEALDAEGRELQRMRTFVQAVPGAVRSCVGCHEDKMRAPRNTLRAMARKYPPAKLQPESWGSGFVDYATMVQPVWDKHCVGCHGGEKGIAAGIDLSGGWTWAFNISYETLLKNTLVGFLNCHNSSVHTSEIHKPRTIGSGAAPLTKILLSGHKGRIPNLTRSERELVMAWMDTNSNYYGTWNWTEYATCGDILSVAAPLKQVMKQSGCTDCHDGTVGNDWVNLRHPERSRILRAPLLKTKSGLGLEWCRKRKAEKPDYPLVTQKHQPPDVFKPHRTPRLDKAGDIIVSFASTDDPYYKEMLSVIRRTRQAALARPRVDMPGADIQPGVCRYLVPDETPERAPELAATLRADEAVDLSWSRSAETIGLTFQIHRGGAPGFRPSNSTLVHTTTMFRHEDDRAPAGKWHYAVLAGSEGKWSAPSYTAVDVPPPAAPPAPRSLVATPRLGEVELEWSGGEQPNMKYNIYRAKPNSKDFEKLNDLPLPSRNFLVADAQAGAARRYMVRSLSRRGLESPPSPVAVARALPERKLPVFSAAFDKDLGAALMDDTAVEGAAKGKAKIRGGLLDLTQGGHVTFPHKKQFDIKSAFSVACWVRLEEKTKMPVVLSCGSFQKAGWFLQALGGRWRWHLGGVNCDGGKADVGQWTHLVATYDGKRARLYQNGREVASVPCGPDPTPWTGPLFVGQYGSSPGPDYQVRGQIARVQIYRRAVQAREAAAWFDKGNFSKQEPRSEKREVIFERALKEG